VRVVITGVPLSFPRPLLGRGHRTVTLGLTRQGSCCPGGDPV
jgi:hypothetical protein